MNVEKVRKALLSIKPKTIHHLANDLSNMDSIMSEYDKISTVANELVDIRGMLLSDALSCQAAEYNFFRQCANNLKAFSEFMEGNVRYTRGLKYDKIRKSESKDLSDKAINTIIDADSDLLGMTFEYLKVKEMYERFHSIVESYHQRGYTLNNLTKALEASVMDYMIQK